MIRRMVFRKVCQSGRMSWHGPKIGFDPRCDLLVGGSRVFLDGRRFVMAADAAPTLPPQVEKIDRVIGQGWADYSLKPSPQEDELKWCRRLFLDVTDESRPSQKSKSFRRIDRRIGS